MAFSKAVSFETPVIDAEDGDFNYYESISPEELDRLEKKVRLKIDLRLCSIAGVLCALTLIDQGILSSGGVTTLKEDLDLTAERNSAAIYSNTIATVVFKLPFTVLARLVGPRIWFSTTTFCFGLITLCTAFIHTWGQMIALRILLGIAMAGVYPGMTFLISVWYTRREQQVRFALMQVGEVIGLATGNIVNFALNRLGGTAGMAGWRWMFLVQGLISCVIGIITYWWMIDFPERAHKSFCFLSDKEAYVASRRIQNDRDDLLPKEFSWNKILGCFADPKLYGLSVMFFILNMITTSLNYFLPSILNQGMGFSSDKSLILATPPYYWAVIPALFTSIVGDYFRTRGPLITFNCLCIIAGYLMIGLPSHVAVRYIGTFLATGAYVSNWAALNAFMANNIVGQWKRLTVAATVAACTGLGSVAGSYIVRDNEAPKYPTAMWSVVATNISMIGFVALFTVYFYLSNRGSIRSETVAFKYTY